MTVRPRQLRAAWRRCPQRARRCPGLPRIYPKSVHFGMVTGGRPALAAPWRRVVAPGRRRGDDATLTLEPSSRTGRQANLAGSRGREMGNGRIFYTRGPRCRRPRVAQRSDLRSHCAVTHDDQHAVGMRRKARCECVQKSREVARAIGTAWRRVSRPGLARWLDHGGCLGRGRALAGDVLQRARPLDVTSAAMVRDSQPDRGCGDRRLLADTVLGAQHPPCVSAVMAIWPDCATCSCRCCDPRNDRRRANTPKGVIR